MAGILPTSGIRPPMNIGALGGAGRGEAATGKSGFAKMLKTYVGNVDANQQASETAMNGLIQVGQGSGELLATNQDASVPTARVDHPRLARLIADELRDTIEVEVAKGLPMAV